MNLASPFDFEELPFFAVSHATLAPPRNISAVGLMSPSMVFPEHRNDKISLPSRK